jgi:crotonobetainyl-CoA:carnitine CoA-transferase CaiB-like acyl-CoA transferase
MLVRHSASGERIGRRGNRDEIAVPHGIFPARGDDRFIAIAIWSDTEWQVLARALGITDDRFATAAGRRANEDALEARIAEATRRLDAFALAEALQASGIDAGPVQNEADLLGDPQLAHRDHFVTLHHRHLGALRFERTGLRLEGSPPRLDRPAPDLGEHTEPVLGELLGLRPNEVRRLVEAGVLV